ncbi:MAG: hypothetical protein R3B53_02820 [Candidatus Paceibacterota bacterium]
MKLRLSGKVSLVVVAGISSFIASVAAAHCSLVCLIKLENGRLFSVSGAEDIKPPSGVKKLVYSQTTPMQAVKNQPRPKRTDYEQLGLSSDVTDKGNKHINYIVLQRHS